MGAHSVPRGEKSTRGAANASPGTPGYKPRHSAAETTPMSTNAAGNRESRLRIPRWLGGGKK